MFTKRYVYSHLQRKKEYINNLTETSCFCQCVQMRTW